MGRGRQKAKQTKIARKLKYLTTDTDYDELAKELRHQEAETDHVDPFVEDSEKYNRDESDSSHNHSYDNDADDVNPIDDDLDDYAKWAAQAAAKATTGEIPATPVVHKPIPMPVPSMLKHKSAAAHSKRTSGAKSGKTAARRGKAGEASAEVKVTDSASATPKASTSRSSTTRRSPSVRRAASGAKTRRSVSATSESTAAKAAKPRRKTAAKPTSKSPSTSSAKASVKASSKSSAKSSSKPKAAEPAEKASTARD